MNPEKLKELEAKINVIHKDIETNLLIVEAFFQDSELVSKRITNAAKKKVLYGLVYLDNSVDNALINRDVLKLIRDHVTKNSPRSQVIAELEDSIANISQVYSLDEAMDFLVQGFVIFFAEGIDNAWVMELRGFPRRAIKEPETEVQARGPKVGFTEIVGENMALLRRIIKSSELKYKTFIIGTKSKTIVVLAYVETLLKDDVLQEIEKRLNSIKTDAIIGSGQLVELITDHPGSPFHQILRSERPDRIAADLLEGKAAIFVDGNPDALILPATMPMFFTTLDEYNTTWLFGSILRLIRWGSFVIAAFLPGFYIAVVSVNHEVLPIEFLIIISESRTKVPFPPILEALLMEVTIEILREAGIRLPGALGQTIGIVGAIVIGDAAIRAGLASNIMVIVVAVTTIATFVLPVFEMQLSLRFIRFPLMVLASMFGLVGLFFGISILIAHLSAMETVGKPYLSPIAPFRTTEMQDTFVRLPFFSITKRPSSAKDIKRQVSNRRKK
ncbi:MAG: spore germination protein [Bacillota bacterium]